MRMTWIVASCFFSLELCAQSVAPRAFVSVNTGAVRIINLQTMSITHSITNVGTEPSRMVSTSDRSRIYLASFITNQGQIYAIDTRSQSVVAFTAAGNTANRNIGLSPDGAKVYTLIHQGLAPKDSAALLVLNAADLTEITTVVISGANCPQNRNQLEVVNDGRIVLDVCTDGLRVIDPISYEISIRGSNARLLGHSPDGSEVYVRELGSASFANSRIGAINITTGTSTRLLWNISVPDNFAGWANSTPLRVTSVPTTGQVASDTLYFFSYFDPSFANAPNASSRASELTGSHTLSGIRTISGTAVIGIDPESGLGLATHLASMQRLRWAPNASANDVLVSDSPIMNLPGAGTLSDMVIVPGAAFANGFE